MKKLSISLIIISVLLIGCSQKEQIKTSAPKTQEHSETTVKHLYLTEENEIAIFSTAVSDSIEEPGIVNIVNPQYKFSLGEESYSLWITEDNGTIMNTKDTHTIYSLSTSSIKELYEFVNKN